ncbi:hypothetical protein [Segetibacter aerophilus]|uniref:Uncharacterized protein n=1 Tax=Segetibacter aerophilus TaxID=670293 RepID=A0A512B6N7_9BACT|nr:hypothetical protein [Segetibacter aerophilus]GEO07633.1 hypothetical protein SAE01_01290 [Segetibacter aerophilus]
MDNYKDLEEANKEIEKSKVILHDTEDFKNKEEREEFERKELGENQEKEQGSGVFTADGKELPNIEGGYDIIEPGGSMGDDDFVSV